MGHRVLIDFANFMYVNSHFVITTSALVWLYLRHNDRFYFVRNMFVVAMGLALVGYLLLPTAPPRFFPELGFVDTLAYYVNVKHDSGLVTLFFNPYAAVPSMHVAFSLLVAVPALLIVKRKVSRCSGRSTRLLVTFVVVVTGNHWLMDALAGAAVAGDGRDRVGARARPGCGRRPGRGSPRGRRWNRAHLMAPERTRRHATRPEPRRLASERARADRRGVSRERARAPGRVAAHAELDLAHRASPSTSRPRCSSRNDCSSSPASRSSSAASWTRSTGATRACRERARSSARSSTRRSTGSRRGSCSPRSARTSPRAATSSRPRRSWWLCSAR